MSKVTIGRSELGLADLELTEPEYGARLVEPGGVTIDRRVATSHQIDGHVTVHARREQATGQLRVDVSGTDAADVQANVDTLIDALSQDEWQLTADVDGTTWVWDCEMADYDVGEATHRFWSGPRVVVTASFPRKPSRAS